MPTSTPHDPMHHSHMPEYVAEFLGTAFMVFAGLSAVVFDWAPDLPMSHWIPDPTTRRFITGFLFAGTGSLVAISPIGKLSGGHINPAVSLVFWLHGKMHWTDLIGYVVAQFLGGIAGAAMLEGVWKSYARSIQDGMTTTGDFSTLAGFVGEVTMTGLMMFAILSFVSSERLMRYTPLMCWVLIAMMVGFEAPISGTSLNPARSLGPALIYGDFQDLWLYFIAPPLGSVLGWALFRWVRHESRYVLTAKLYQNHKYRTVFRPEPGKPIPLPFAE